MKKNQYFIYIFFLFLYFFITNTLFSENKPIAKKGLLDLSGIDLKESGTIRLRGEWEFYWLHLLTPKDFNNNSKIIKPKFMNIPGIWSEYKINGEKLPPDGYATFRLTLKIKKEQTLKALYLPVQYTAYKLWCRGQVFVNTFLRMF